MTSSELKDLVKSHFNLVEASEGVVEENFGSIKAKDGAFTVYYDGEELAVGKIVEVELPDGTRTQAPDGEHILADDTTIVTEGSRIVDIKETRELAEEEDKEEMSAATEETFAEDGEEEEMEEDIKEEEMEEEAVKVEDIVEAIVSEVKDEMAKMKDKMAALEDKVAKMESMPAAEPTITQTGKKMKAETKRGFAAFDVNKSRNADRIKMAIEELKTKKK